MASHNLRSQIRKRIKVKQMVRSGRVNPKQRKTRKRRYTTSRWDLVAMVSLYKSGRWIKQRLDNLLETTLFKRGKMLVYCVNADSPDEDDEKIPLKYNHLPNFKYERIDFCTVYAAWNHVIRKTDTEFITNANADDLIAPTGYDSMIRLCETTGASMAYCAWYTIGPQHKKWSSISGDFNHTSQYDPNTDNVSCGHFPLWRRSLHDVVGLFDPWFQAIGDADFWYRCWLNNIRDFELIQQPLGAYRWLSGGNLWHRTEEGQRAKEWKKISTRKKGKLEF